jgi:hypothetical protein
MKNFSEATAIKPNLKLVVSLTLDPIGQPTSLVKINGARVFDSKLIRTTVITHEIELEDYLDLSIQIYRNHPDAVQVYLTIDGVEILPKYLHLALPSTNYLDQSGIWVFRIPSFYPWLHEITGQGWII